MTLYFLFILFFLFIIYIIFFKRNEFFSCKKLNCYPSGDYSHCPNQCTPFMYPEMYSTKGKCSDPFSWGFIYSTGRCPHVFNN